MSLKKYQKAIDDWAQTLEKPYWHPLSQFARLSEEVGEVGRLLNHLYGDKPKKTTEAKQELPEELADILFAVLCLANTHDIDLDTAMNAVIAKASGRDADRFRKKTYYVTICSKEKNDAKKLLPAIKRYTADHIKQAIKKSKRDDVGLLILSGKFGLLKPGDTVPYYDFLLTTKDIPKKLPTVIKQLQALAPEEIIILRPKIISSQRKPYYDLLSQAAKKAGVKLQEMINE